MTQRAIKVRDVLSYVNQFRDVQPEESLTLQKALPSDLYVGSVVYTYVANGHYRRSKVKALSVGAVILDCPDPINPQSTVYAVTIESVYVKVD